MFERIISIENLLLAWKEFIKGKRKKLDVQLFQMNLMDHIFSLHRDLVNQTYIHGPYQAFKINDPKPRDIHKASVRDRLLHHAIYRILYPFFDRKFIADSYSCRIGKGTHKALNRFRQFSYEVSQNHTRTAWVLKCDIKKFFANIDHVILKRILAKHDLDVNILWLLSCVIDSFDSGIHGTGWSGPDLAGKCLPLGNLTSQLLVNVYMNEFDQFVKHGLKVKHYIRYADDFVILSDNRLALQNLIPQIQNFLRDALRLEIHPNKLSIETIASGVDYLGWVHFPDYRVLRTATKRRMIRRITIENVASYIGLLRYGNTLKLERQFFSH